MKVLYMWNEKERKQEEDSTCIKEREKMCDKEEDGRKMCHDDDFTEIKQTTM